MKKHLFVILFLFVLLLVGCSDEKNIKGIIIDRETVKESYYLNEFTIDDIDLIVIYDDDTNEKVSLEEVFMNKTIDQISSQVGNHEISITYKDFETILNVTITNQIFNIKYYYNNELVNEQEFIKNEEIKDLYDYETTENDTVWYYDEAFTQKVILPFSITSDMSLYTNNLPVEIVFNNIIYRETQDGGYMVYGRSVPTTSILFVPEEINNKKVTSISNNLNEEVFEYGIYESVFLPKTITSIPVNPETNHPNFFMGLYHINVSGGLRVNNYPGKEYPGGMYSTGALQVEDYIITEDAIYGLINGELYLLDFTTYQLLDEYVIETEVNGYKVTGVACFAGIANRTKKLIIPSEIKNIELLSLSGFTYDSYSTCEIIFEGSFSDYEEDFNYIFGHDIDYKITFINDVSSSMTDFYSKYEQETKPFIFHESSIIVEFKDGVVYTFENGIIFE